jgi:hypothetical protein
MKIVKIVQHLITLITLSLKLFPKQPIKFPSILQQTVKSLHIFPHTNDHKFRIEYLRVPNVLLSGK